MQVWSDGERGGVGAPHSAEASISHCYRYRLCTLEPLRCGTPNYDENPPRTCPPPSRERKLWRQFVFVSQLSVASFLSSSVHGRDMRGERDDCPRDAGKSLKGWQLVYCIIDRIFVFSWQTFLQSLIHFVFFIIFVYFLINLTRFVLHIIDFYLIDQIYKPNMDDFVYFFRSEVES